MWLDYKEVQLDLFTVIIFLQNARMISEIVVSVVIIKIYIWINRWLSISVTKECICIFIPIHINSFLHRQNGRHFPQDIFKCIFVNGMFCILIWISLKFVPQGPIDNKWALVQVMAWHHIGAKALPELMLIQFTDAYIRHEGEMS